MSRLLCIVGPTGVGKTSLAIELAQEFNGELISADSRQIYVGMDIATGKEVSSGKWQQYRGRKTLMIHDVPIFGLDLVLPDTDFSVFEWLKKMDLIIREVRADGKLPIIIGGTGFYLQALQGKIETLAIKPNVVLRQELERLTASELSDKLRKINPGAVSRVDPLNRRRLIRSIEILTSQRSSNLHDSIDVEFHELNMIGLTMPRAALYEKVDARIDQMFKEGLVDEARELLGKYDCNLPSLTGIGYAEARAYLEGEISLEQARQQVKWRTHAYIRRQYTWFRKQKVEWVDMGLPNWKQDARQLVAKF